MGKAHEAHVAVFAPVTVLTITLEGVWQARMVKTLGSRVTICTLTRR